MYKSTSKWSKWWRERKIDWKTHYLDGWNHPHRELIIQELKKRKFGSVCELGMASGPNLVRIRKEFPRVQVGGIDVNADAIKMAKMVFPDGIFDVRSVDNLFFSDKSVDVVLTDMTMIYCDERKIMKSLKEIKRVARNFAIFVEFHHKSWFMRTALRLFKGYHSYDWPKILKQAGFYDIELKKMTEEDWPGGEPQKTYGYIITASIR